MIKKAKKYLLNFTCVMLSIFVVCSSFSVCAYAQETYISEVAISSGANARENLEKKGYTVLFQGMNLVTNENDSSAVFLGYKKGSSAITDFIVSTTKNDSINYNSCTYNLVSNTSLNVGVGGTAIYLYYTKDSSAGDAITSLDTVSGFSDTDEVVSLKNDGSSPVRTDDGKLANLDKGISNNELYLLMYRNAGIKQYISKVCKVTATSKAKAVNAAASKGCDYYLDSDLSSDKNKVTYVAYQRTADKSQAITQINFDDELKFSNDENATSALVDISSAKLFDKSFTLGEWAGVYAASDKSISRSSKEYKALASSKDECSCVRIGSSKLYAIYLGKVQVSADETTTFEETTEQESTTSEEVTDEFLDIEKEEETTTEVTDENNKTASVFGSGSAKKIIIFSAITVLVIVGLFVYKKMKGKKNNEEKD